MSAREEDKTKDKKAVEDTEDVSLDLEDFFPLQDVSAAVALQKLMKIYEPLEKLDKMCETASPIVPPPHYAEFMLLKGWLDLDLTDPDLAPLFK